MRLTAAVAIGGWVTAEAVAEEVGAVAAVVWLVGVKVEAEVCCCWWSGWGWVVVVVVVLLLSWLRRLLRFVKPEAM